MRQPNIASVSRSCGIKLCLNGYWRFYYWSFGEWDRSGELACIGVQYALDFAALHLRSAEAFIVVLSAVSNIGIARFDENAVRQLIRKANKIWEFVK